MKKRWRVWGLWMIAVILLFPGCGGKSEEAKAPAAPAPAAATPAEAPSQVPAVEAPSVQVQPGVPGKAPAAAVPAKPGEGRILLAARFPSSAMAGGAPPGWELETKSGTPVVRLEPQDNAFCLRLTSDSESSFGIKKEIRVDIREYPFMNWRWKVNRLPKGGDVRSPDTDDQALQIYVAFPATGWPEALNTPVVGYIWDSEAPKGWMGSSSHTGAGMLRYVVVRNKTDRLGQWSSEKRNILQDYQKLFRDVKSGQPQGPTRGLQLYINSQHTRSGAEGFVCEIYFSQS